MSRSAVWEVLLSEGGGYLSIDYDPECGMLASFAAALHEHARCVDCGAPPQGDFSRCPCDGGHAFFNWRVDHASWKSIIEPLWKKDRRRAYGRRTYELRRDAIRDSDEPAYAVSDVAWLRKVQNDACYYCGTSILTNAQVEHLEPLAKGGSNGFRNIMLACPSCNVAKGALNEAQFWRKLRKTLHSAEFERLRESAKIMKREKWRRRGETAASEISTRTSWNRDSA